MANYWRNVLNVVKKKRGDADQQSALNVMHQKRHL